MNFLQDLKEKFDARHLDIEHMNQEVNDLTKDSPSDQRKSLLEPVHDLNRRWQTLMQEIAGRKVGGCCRINNLAIWDIGGLSLNTIGWRTCHYCRIS